MARPRTQKNTAELQLDGVRGNQLAADCVPHGIGRHRQGATRRARWRPDDLRDEVRLLVTHRSPEDIAAALGYAGPGSIARSLHRLGEHQLARPFDSAQNRLRSAAV